MGNRRCIVGLLACIIAFLLHGCTNSGRDKMLQNDAGNRTSKPMGLLDKLKGRHGSEPEPEPEPEPHGHGDWSKYGGRGGHAPEPEPEPQPTTTIPKLDR